MKHERRSEIEAKAKEINDLSERFQLIHATYAAQEYIKDITKEFYKQQLAELQKRICEKMDKELDTTKEMEEKEDLENRIKHNLFHIGIGYISTKNENIARIVKNENSFTIYLASSLRDNIFTKDGDFNYKVISTIRKLMSHELGHLVLHTKDLLQEDGTQGSLNIRDAEKEEEADVFGKALLKLRKDRNKKISFDGGAENLF